MTASSILLRLLLVAALILNGIGSAVAGARMLGAADTPSVAGESHHAAVTRASSHGDCHEQAAPAQSAAHALPGDAHDGSCCDDGRCACHCMQQAQGVFPPPVPASVQFAQATTARSASRAHESPPPPHLIRPPIRQAA